MARSRAILSSPSTRPEKGADPVLVALSGVWYSSGVSGEIIKSLPMEIADGVIVSVGRRRGLLAGMVAIASDDELDRPVEIM
jgi:hypothetical protein